MQPPATASQFEAADQAAAANERLTAIAGTILVVLLTVETVTVLSLRLLMWAHIVVGVLLAGPLLVKLGSTGYRFVRYYLRSPAYLRRGPPRLPLRLMAPLLVGATLLLMATGFGLLLTGPDTPGPLVFLHNVSALVWFPLITLHGLAYLRRLPRLLAGEWTKQPPRWVPGGRLRLALNAGALVLGAIAAIVLLSTAGPWTLWSTTTQAVPAPLIVGAVLTAIALVVARPLRWT